MLNSMDRAEELRLISEANALNSSAFERLLQVHTPMIHKLAGRVSSLAAMHDELIQAGRIGFMHALRRYNAEKDVRLITYAVPWIIGEMKQVLRNRINGYSSELILCDCQDLHNEHLIHAEKESLEALLNGIDLKKAVSSLNCEDQKLIWLRYFRDKTQKETALLLHKSQAQISKTERRILDDLRSQLM